ncbi:MAG: flagellar hook-length control protein [Anaerocolumna sp.]|jgi:flagellar hook-length control protein FliK|nr:flagellar hook-length control protein [Anaerocolumna sp.]
MTQNVMLNFVSTYADKQKGIANAGSKSTKSAMFENYFDNNLKEKDGMIQKKETDNLESNTVITKTDSRKQVVLRNETSAMQNQTMNESVKSVQNSEVEEITDETQLECVKTILDRLKGTVQSILDLSEEELEQYMESLGFMISDLLNPEKMKQLVLQVSGQDDITSVLMDEQLSESMNQLLLAVNELTEGQDFIIPQEILDKLNGMYEESLTLADGEMISANQETANSVGVNHSPGISGEADSEGLASTKVEVVMEESKIPVKQNLPEEAEPGQTNQQVSTVTDSANNTFSDASHTASDNNLMDAEPVELVQTEGQGTPGSIDGTNEAFLQNLFGLKPTDQLNVQNQIVNVGEFQEITRQIVEQIKILINPEQTSMELQLNPENLGKINLSVVSKNGVMTAQFTTQNAMTKEALESQMQVLKDNLNNQGLKVESIEVTVSNFDFSQSSNQAFANEGQQSHSKGRTFNPYEEELESNQPEEINLLNDSMEQLGTSVDYTA